MKKIWIGWIISLLLAVACPLVNNQLFRIDHIIPLEFSRSAAMMKEIILTIGSRPADCYHTLQMNTIIDYGFIVSYSLLAFFSFKLFLDAFQLRSNVWWVYALSFITGCLDIIENYFLLKTATAQNEDFSMLFFWVVRLKWAFSIVPFLLVPMVLFYGLVLLLRAKQNTEPVISF